MIPDEAVEAAWDKLHENPVRPIGIDWAELTAALEAAAPYLMAAAYTDGYCDGMSGEPHSLDKCPVEAAARALYATEAQPIYDEAKEEVAGHKPWEWLNERSWDSYRNKARAALGAAAPRMMAPRTEIGYVCRHGHFQFHNDPDGDACGTKRVGGVYVEAAPEISPEELAEAIGYALESHHRKMEEWRSK